MTKLVAPESCQSSSSCLAILFPQQLFAGSHQLGRNCVSAVNVRGLFIENAFLIHERCAFRGEGSEVLRHLHREGGSSAWKAKARTGVSGENVGACSPDTPLRAFAAPAPSRNYHLRVPTVCLTGVPPHQGELLEAPAHLPGTSPPDASGIANKEGKDPWLPRQPGAPPS